LAHDLLRLAGKARGFRQVFIQQTGIQGITLPMAVIDRAILMLCVENIHGWDCQGIISFFADWVVRGSACAGFGARGCGATHA
jgi:hypothetical protein